MTVLLEVQDLAGAMTAAASEQPAMASAMNMLVHSLPL
jgi:hypothetical protein